MCETYSFRNWWWFIRLERLLQTKTVFVHPLWMVATYHLKQDFGTEFFHKLTYYIFINDFYSMSMIILLSDFTLTFLNIFNWYVFIQPDKKIQRKLDSTPLQARQMLQTRTPVSLFERESTSMFIISTYKSKCRN